MIRLITLGLLAIGCRAGQNYDDVYTGPVHGKVSGLVTSIDGSPLSGVNVSAQDVSAVTAEDGTYTLLDVEPAENIVVQFSKQGYAKNYTTATLHSWETVASNASLIEADGLVAIDSTTPSNVEVFGTKIRFVENFKKLEQFSDIIFLPYVDKKFNFFLKSKKAIFDIWSQIKGNNIYSKAIKIPKLETIGKEAKIINLN